MPASIDGGRARRTARTAAVLAVVVGCASPSALAQARAGFRPLFAGAANADPAARAALTMSVTVSEAYDQDLLADAGATPQPGAAQASGMYTSLMPLVSLSTHGKRIGFSMGGGSTLRRYAEFGRTVATNHNAAAGFSADVGRRTTVVANQAVSYSPSYLYALFGDTPSTPTAGEQIAGAPDYKTTSFQSYTSATSAALSHSFSPRASFSFDASLRRTNFIGNVAGVGDMQYSGAGSHYRYNVSHGIVVSVGYSHWQSRNSLLRTTEHDLESGLGFTRVLSATRRATFGFNVGPTLAEIEVPIAGRWEKQGGHYRVVGDAFFERELARTWSTRASYRRGLTYVEAFAGPVYTDTASVVATGFLNRRFDLLFSAAYVTGEMALQTTAAARFTTYTGDARLRMALSRNVAAYVEGLLYDYAFDPRLVILPGVPSQFTRTGVRVGLTLWTAPTAEHHAAR
jgi:hypothetical protein